MDGVVNIDCYFTLILFCCVLFHTVFSFAREEENYWKRYKRIRLRNIRSAQNRQYYQRFVSMSGFPNTTKKSSTFSTNMTPLFAIEIAKQLDELVSSRFVQRMYTARRLERRP